MSAVDDLKAAGGKLANIAFNLAQKNGQLLQHDHCLSLDAARREWDAAIVAHALEAAPALRQLSGDEDYDALKARHHECMAICEAWKARAVLAAAQAKEQPK